MIYIPREDSYLLAEEVKKFASGKKVLDMGSGSGIQARTAIKAGAKHVIASDVDIESVRHLKKLKIRAVHSNLFEKLKDKFDLIVFNPPYLPNDKREDVESKLVTTGGKNGDEIILKFLKEAPGYLNRGGIILLLVSSLTPQIKIESLIKRIKLKKEVIGKQNIFFEKLEVWKIEKA